MKILLTIAVTLWCAALLAFIDHTQGLDITRESVLRGALGGLFVGGLLSVAVGARSRRNSTMPDMDDEEPGNRHWFRFSLGSILWLVTVVSVFLGWLGCHWQIVRERQACFTSITWSGEEPPFSVSQDQRPVPFPRNWLGDKRLRTITVHSDLDEKSIARIREAHPEAEMFIKMPQGNSRRIYTSQQIYQQRASHQELQNRAPQPPEELATAREDFDTNLIRKGPAPQPYRNAQPPAGVQQLEYLSGDLKLKGWLSAPPTDDKKHPAVVFLHGGFAFAANDWNDAAPFAEAGFVLFMPTVRGENGNPGSHESFYGEVDDAIAAGRFVASLPYVDSKRIFVAGHSSGAVLTSLTAMMPSPYRAAAALDGYFNMKDWVASFPRHAIPYDLSDPEEIRVRNPLEFASTLKIPIALYVGESRMVNEVFLARAQKAKKACKLEIVPGDHQTMVAPAVQKAIIWFQSQASE